MPDDTLKRLLVRLGLDTKDFKQKIQEIKKDLGTVNEKAKQDAAAITAESKKQHLINLQLIADQKILQAQAQTLISEDKAKVQYEKAQQEQINTKIKAKILETAEAKKQQLEAQKILTLSKQQLELDKKHLELKQQEVNLFKVGTLKAAVKFEPFKPPQLGMNPADQFAYINGERTRLLMLDKQVLALELQGKYRKVDAEHVRSLIAAELALVERSEASVKLEQVKLKTLQQQAIAAAKVASPVAIAGLKAGIGFAAYTPAAQGMSLEVQEASLIKERQKFATMEAQLKVLAAQENVRKVDVVAVEKEINVERAKLALDEVRLKTLQQQAIAAEKTALSLQKKAAQVVVPAHMGTMRDEINAAMILEKMSRAQINNKLQENAIRRQTIIAEQGILKTFEAEDKYSKAELLTMQKTYRVELDRIAAEEKLLRMQLARSKDPLFTRLGSMMSMAGQRVASTMLGVGGGSGPPGGGGPGGVLSGPLLGGFGTIAGGMFTGMAGFAIFNKLIESVHKLTEELIGATGAERQLEATFERLAARKGIDPSEFLNKMRRSTRGLVDDMQLYRISNNFMRSGMKLTEDQLNRLITNTVNLARANGRLERAIPALERFFITGRAMALGMAVGIDRQHLALKGLSPTLDATTRKTLEFTKVLAEEERMLGRVGVPATTLPEVFKQIQVAQHNFFDEMAKGMLKGSGLGNTIAEISRKLTELQPKFDRFAEELGVKLAKAITWVIDHLDEIKVAVETFIGLKILDRVVAITGGYNAWGDAIGYVIAQMGRIPALRAAVKGITIGAAEGAAAGAAGAAGVEIAGAAGIGATVAAAIPYVLAAVPLIIGAIATYFVMSEEERRIALEHSKAVMDNLERYGSPEGPAKKKATYKTELDVEFKGITAAQAKGFDFLTKMQDAVRSAFPVELPKEESPEDEAARRKLAQQALQIAQITSQTRLDIVKQRIEEEENLLKNQYDEGLISLERYVSKEKSLKDDEYAAEIRRIRETTAAQIKNIHDKTTVTIDGQEYISENQKVKDNLIAMVTLKAKDQEIKLTTKHNHEIHALDKQLISDRETAYRSYTESIIRINKEGVQARTTDLEQEFKQGRVSVDNYIQQRKDLIEEEYRLTIQGLNDRLEANKNNAAEIAKIDGQMAEAIMTKQKEITKLILSEDDIRLHSVQTRYEQTRKYLATEAAIAKGQRGGGTTAAQIQAIELQLEFSGQYISQLQEQLKTENLSQEAWIKITEDIGKATEEQQRLNIELAQAKDIANSLSGMFGSLAEVIGSFGGPRARGIAEWLQDMQKVEQRMSKFSTDLAQYGGTKGLFSSIATSFKGIFHPTKPADREVKLTAQQMFDEGLKKTAGTMDMLRDVIKALTEELIRQKESAKSAYMNLIAKPLQSLGPSKFEPISSDYFTKVPSLEEVGFGEQPEKPLDEEYKTLMSGFSGGVDRATTSTYHLADAGDHAASVLFNIKPKGSYQKGTEYVPETGIYTLHKGEKVLTKEEVNKSKEVQVKSIEKIKELQSKKQTINDISFAERQELIKNYYALKELPIKFAGKDYSESLKIYESFFATASAHKPGAPVPPKEPEKGFFDKLFDKIKLPSYQVGTDYVPETTSALVHEGEVIDRRTPWQRMLAMAQDPYSELYAKDPITGSPLPDWSRRMAAGVVRPVTGFAEFLHQAVTSPGKTSSDIIKSVDEHFTSISKIAATEEKAGRKNPLPSGEEIKLGIGAFPMIGPWWESVTRRATEQKDILGATTELATGMVSLPEAMRLTGKVGVKTIQESPRLLYEETGSLKLPSRSQRAIKSYKPSTAQKQQLADVIEKHVAEIMRGKATGHTNAPFDVLYGKRGIEVKTLIDQINDKLTMHPESLARKLDAAKQLKSAYTVGVDARGFDIERLMSDKKYRATLPTYYREGLGSFRLGSMMDVGTLQKLRSVLPSYQVGVDYVPKTGLALLHKGEQVIPADESIPSYQLGTKAHKGENELRQFADALKSAIQALGQFISKLQSSVSPATVEPIAPGITPAPAKSQWSQSPLGKLFGKLGKKKSSDEEELPSAGGIVGLLPRSSIPVFGAAPGEETPNGMDEAGGTVQSFTQKLEGSISSLSDFAKGIGTAAEGVGGFIQGITSAKSGAGGAFSGLMSGAQMGMQFGGPIGAVVGAVGGGIIGGFAGAKEKQLREDLHKVQVSMQSIVDSMNEGAITLSQAIQDMRKEREQAIKLLSRDSKKGGKGGSKKGKGHDPSQIQAAINAIDAQIAQLVNTQKQLLDQLNQQVAVLANPLPFQQYVQSLDQIIEKYQQFANAAAGNAQDVAKAQLYLNESLQNYVQTLGQELNQAQQTAIQDALTLLNLEYQRQQIINQEAQQEYDILTQGVLTRQRTTAMTKGQEIGQLRYQRDMQLEQLDEQIALQKYKVETEQKIFGLATTRVGLEMQLLALQEEAAGTQNQQTAALLQVFQQLQSAMASGSLMNQIEGLSAGGASPTGTSLLTTLLGTLGLGGYIPTSVLTGTGGATNYLAQIPQPYQSIANFINNIDPAFLLNLWKAMQTPPGSYQRQAVLSEAQPYAKDADTSGYDWEGFSRWIRGGPPIVGKTATITNAPVTPGPGALPTGIPFSMPITTGISPSTIPSYTPTNQSAYDAVTASMNNLDTSTQSLAESMTQLAKNIDDIATGINQGYTQAQAASTGTQVPSQSVSSQIASSQITGFRNTSYQHLTVKNIDATDITTEKLTTHLRRYQLGGPVIETGPAHLEEGEYVLPKPVVGMMGMASGIRNFITSLNTKIETPIVAPNTMGAPLVSALSKHIDIENSLLDITSQRTGMELNVISAKQDMIAMEMEHLDRLNATVDRISQLHTSGGMGGSLEGQLAQLYETRGRYGSGNFRKPIL